MYISTHYNFKWTGSSKNFNFDQLRAENTGGEKKMINHLERHYLLSAKDKLYLNMRRYCEKQKLNVFNYLPLQYVLDLQSKDSELEIEKFCHQFNHYQRIKHSSQLEEKEKSMFDGGNIWLIKPNGLNRGIGIKLFTSLKQLRSLLKEASQRWTSESGSGIDIQIRKACAQI